MSIRPFCFNLLKSGYDNTCLLALSLGALHNMDIIVGSSCECLKCRRVEGLTVAFWHIKACRFVERYRRFGRTCSLHIQGIQRRGKERKKIILASPNSTASLTRSSHAKNCAFFPSASSPYCTNIQPRRPSSWTNLRMEVASSNETSVTIKEHGVVSLKT